MSDLNMPVSLEEAMHCLALPTGRAPDMQGLTGELLRLLRLTTRLQGMVSLFVQLLLSVRSGCCMPCYQMHMFPSPYVPASWSLVPKAKAPAALMDMDMHRGISVSQLFSRSLDRLLNRKLEAVVSRLGLRSPTQCGFRPGHGTLDAIFTLQHLIHS